MVESSEEEDNDAREIFQRMPWFEPQVQNILSPPFPPQPFSLDESKRHISIIPIYRMNDVSYKHRSMNNAHDDQDVFTPRPFLQGSG